MKLRTMDRRALYILSGLALTLGVCVAVFWQTPQTAASTLRIPKDPNEVLERLPFAASDERSREVRSLRRTLAVTPGDLGSALRLAQLNVTLARERSDPRYLGHAEAALKPWWSLQTPPVDVLVLRATILQSLHAFEAALVDLDQAVRMAPNHAQAWLTRAVVLTVRGRYREARESCARLVEVTSNLVVVVCETGVDSLTGNAARSHQRLSRALADARGLSPAEEAWAHSSLGEYALRAGRLDEAEQHFRRTLQLDPNDGYARAAAADLFLDRNQPAEALALVRGREINDTLLLRMALAEQRSGAKEAQSHVDALEARFNASRIRGDVVHRREEARFWLELKGDAARALELARANWDVQKEPADARILVEAARAAKEPSMAEPVLVWLSQTKLEDPFIKKAVKDLSEGVRR